MKLSKIIIAVLLVSALSVPLISCRSGISQEAEPEYQLVTVQRGDLVVDITATGNLLYSHQEEMAFEIAGTVEEVLVEAGDSVEEGQVLARLDTSAWEEQVKVLEKQLTAAKRQLTAAERQLQTKIRNVSAKEFALRQAQIDLQTAEYNVTVIADVKAAQDAIDKAEAEIELAELKLKETLEPGANPLAYQYWVNEKTLAEARLAEAQQELRELLAGTSVTVTTDVLIEVEKKKLQVEQAQRQIEDAQVAIEYAQLDVDDARLDVEDAQQAVEDAREALDEALSTSPEITASFTGFVIMVNVDGGDEVKKGTVAVVIADPNKFEADILVNEIDILQVKPGIEAYVQVDSLQGTSFPADVTHVSPTATIQQGVVNYKVKVELQSLEAIAQEQQAAGQEAVESMRESIQQGEMPERLKQAVEEGRLTQEQADEMMKRMQEGLGTQPEQGRQPGQMPTAIPQDFQLRQGLTVTVSIIVDERTDVLIVPNSAITTRGLQTYVQVMSPDGTIEERAITTGISDWQYTEVIQGLSEGEQVVVPKGTATTTPSSSQQQQRPGGFMPGMGGFGR